MLVRESATTRQVAHSGAKILQPKYLLQSVEKTVPDAMEEFPTSEDEFDLMYGDDLEVLRDQEGNPGENKK